MPTTDKRKRRVTFKEGGVIERTDEGTTVYSRKDFTDKERARISGISGKESPIARETATKQDLQAAEDAKRAAVEKEIEQEQFKNEVTKETPLETTREDILSQIQERTAAELAALNKEYLRDEKGNVIIGPDGSPVVDYIAGTNERGEPIQIPVTANQVQQAQKNEISAFVSVGLASTGIAKFGNILKLNPNKVASNTMKTKIGNKITSNVEKQGFLARIKGVDLVKVAIGGSAVGLLNARVSDIETSIINFKESATNVVDGATTESLSVDKALEQLDAIEEEIDEMEAKIKKAGEWSVRFKFGKGLEIQSRLFKAKQDLIIKRGKISATAATRAEDIEELTKLYDELGLT